MLHITVLVYQWKKETIINFLFLDALVKREENITLTSVYKKKTFTGCDFNFQSNCSIKKKVSLIITLCHRAHTFFQELRLS